MSTAIAPARPSVFAIGGDFGFKPIFFKRDNGALAFQRVPVFRSGTFRDSMGIQSTWESLHMQQMITNYNHLRDTNIFRDQPVREQHPNWLMGPMPGVGQVVGWHTNLTVEKLTSPVDGKEYHYILADYDITDARAQQRVLEGTWRNRSSEIGTYTTNDEAEFWPVYMGFAFVDMPAVEGLNFASQPGGSGTTPRFFVMDVDYKERLVTGTQPAVQPAAGGLLGVTGTPHSFSINGQSVTDYTAVQNHINVLEAFRNETTDGNKVAFVNGLAQANKILATQIESTLGFARTLNPEQYAAWTKTFDTAAQVPALGMHGGTATGATVQATPASPAAPLADLDLARETVNMSLRAGVPAEQVKKSPSFKKLEAAGQAPSL